MGSLNLSEVILFPTSFVIKLLFLSAHGIFGLPLHLSASLDELIKSFRYSASLVTCQMTDLSQMPLVNLS